ncbi:MAG: phage tail tape measure protein [Pseudomonadota bacterium]
MVSMDRIDDLDLQVEALDQHLGQPCRWLAAFNTELGRMREAFAVTGQDVQTLERGFSRGLTRALRGAVLHGDSLSDALENLANSMINAAFNAAVRPVSNHIGGLLGDGLSNLVGGILPFEKGAPFSQGRVQPFASGGIVSSPTTFPMRGGTGLMGEAGPEAIMPLSRGADGRLGVRAMGGRAINVTMNVSTPDVEGFRRSRAQVAAQLGRAIGAGSRNR